MSILIKGMDMLKDGTYTSNIHVKGGKAILDNPIGLGYFELVEVMHGEWVDTNPNEPLDPRVTCSRCGDTEVLFKGNFCPNCGADMRGKICQEK